MIAREMFEVDAASRKLGIELIELSPGHARMSMVVTEDMVNGYAITHGGYVFLLADTTFAMACNSHGHPAVGRSCSIEYLAPALPGDVLTASAVERSVVGRGGIYDVAVTRDADGALLAEMRGHSRQVAPAPGTA